MRSLRCFAALGLAVTLCASPALAQEPDDPPAAAAPQTTHGRTLHGTLNLSLADAIAMSLENNLNVEVERHAPLIAYEDSQIAWGAYDPEFFSEFSYSSIKNPNANALLSLGGAPIFDSTNRNTSGFSGLRGIVPWLGAEYTMQFDSSRRTTNNTIEALSPELRSSWFAEVTMPLMKDLIWNEPWTQVKTSRIVHEASRENFRREVMNTVRDTEQRYWGLIAADERVRVAEKSLETAQALLVQTETQYQVGVISRVDVAEAEAGVAEREFGLIVAKNFYRNTMDELIDLVLGPNLTADSRIEIEPTDRPEEYVPYQIDVEEAVGIAFAYRPERAIADREIERLVINLKFAENQRLPTLDGFFSFGNRGLAGEQNPNFTSPGGPPVSIRTTSYGDTFDDWFSDDASDQFTAGARFSIQLPNTSARHGVSKAELELRRAHTQRRRVEQDIILEVRRSARNLESAQEGIEAAERRVAAEEEKVRAARIRLEYGESTPFDVLDRERDLVEAESEKIGAFQTYRNSVTDLDRSQGTILRNRNIAIDRVSRLR